MTRFIYDNFTKQYLEEVLSKLGEVEPSKKIISERLEIDVFFTPSPEKKERLSELGLLGKMLTNITLIEAYHNPVTKEEIMGCMGKLCLVCDEIFRTEKKEGNSQINWEELPYLWIITPTASRQILNFFRVIKDPSKWGEGIYILS
ncbi:MAG TPA: flagellar assembly protein H, partial [Allocoleopsis sp.]